MDKLPRCSYVPIEDPLYVEYHDHEWGRLDLERCHLFELLILESFQAGLSWSTILHKREAFRKAYEGFVPEIVASFDEEKIQSLLGEKGIIRHKGKIRASVKNARSFLQVEKEFGSFANYLLSFFDHYPLYEYGLTVNDIAIALSKDMRKRGFAYMGPVIVYSYLQAIGLIDSHEPGCYLFRGEIVG